MTDFISVESQSSGYGLRHVVGGELIKFRSLRSTTWTLLVTFIGSFVVTFLATNNIHRHGRGAYQGFDPTNQAMTGLALGTLAIGVLGVLAITGEYSTGTIRSSLAATPRRPLLLAGKVAVVGGIALAVSEVLTFSCFGIGQAVLSAVGAPTASLSQAGVLRAVMLSGAFVALLGLVGLALGVIIRNTAGAISAYVGITFLLPVLLNRIPGNPGRFTPIPMLANSVSAVVPQDQVSAPVAFLLMALYCTAILAVAAAVIVRRDA